MKENHCDKTCLYDQFGAIDLIYQSGVVHRLFKDTQL